MSLGKSLCAAAVLAALASAPARAALEFSRTTDSVYIQGATPLSNQATLEAVVKVPPNSPNGRVFTEWSNGLMDVDLGVAPNGPWGYFYPPTIGFSTASAPLTPNVWHQEAFVYDGSETRLYLDGHLVQTVSAFGTIGTSPQSIVSLGAIFRDNQIDFSFIGQIQSLRISNTARYTTSAFTPTLGDLPSDANTLLLYNFDVPSNPSDVLVTDLSGHQRTGVLGIGFVGATSPHWVVPEPSTISILLAAPAVWLGSRKRTR